MYKTGPSILDKLIKLDPDWIPLLRIACQKITYQVGQIVQEVMCFLCKQWAPMLNPYATSGTLSTDDHLWAQSQN